MVRNGISRVCYYFCSTERNSELFSLPRKGSERNSASMLLFLIHGTEFRVVFFSAEGFGMDVREFLFRGTAGISSEITICSVSSVFHGIIFLSEIPNPSPHTDYFQSFTEHICSTARYMDFKGKTSVFYVLGNIKSVVNVTRVHQLLHFIFIKLTILFLKS